ncbi:ligase [Aureococcus anophagefferens]|nr:ligase [Aureococcus anophagefferens]
MLLSKSSKLEAAPGVFLEVVGGPSFEPPPWPTHGAGIEFELEDLPAHAMILMEARLPAQKGNALYESPKLVLECCDANSVPVITLLPDASVAGLFTLDSELSKTPGPAVPKATKDDLALFVARTLRRQPDDVCINIMPLFHIHGVIANIMVTLYSGSRVVCTRGFQGGDDFLDKLADDSLGPPTWYSAVPTMHEAILLAAEDRGSKALGPFLADAAELLQRRCCRPCPSASSTPGTKLKKEFTVVPTYAMTESFPICSNPPHLECKLSTVKAAAEALEADDHKLSRFLRKGEEKDWADRGRSWQVAGVGEKNLEKLTYADGRYLFPPHISITLSMNDDLSDFWFQQHALHYEDERHALHKLDMRRTLKELMRRRKLYGKEWESPLELGDGLMKYDWHGDLVVRDLSLFDPDRPIRDQDAEVIIMHHKWRKNCRDAAAGAHHGAPQDVTRERA